MAIYHNHRASAVGGSSRRVSVRRQSGQLYGSGRAGYRYRRAPLPSALGVVAAPLGHPSKVFNEAAAQLGAGDGSRSMRRRHTNHLLARPPVRFCSYLTLLGETWAERAPAAAI